MWRKTQFGKKGGFTIVELLTVMSVIIILIGLLVPALNKVKQFAKEVRQRAQFHSIDVAMELFETENDGYPDSDELDNDSQPYCGAMKLAEAMVGQDLLGFHRDAVFNADFMNALNTRQLYQNPPTATIDPEDEKARMGPYLQLENANATRLTPYVDATTGIDEAGIWNSASDVDPFTNEYTFVLCDVYTRQMQSGYKVGMPILYYKADLNGDRNPNRVNDDNEDVDGRIYKHEDNDDLVTLVNPWNGLNGTHPMASTGYTKNASLGRPWEGLPDSFYWQINNDDIPIQNGRPYKSDSYILLSAGFDGLYGTRDDIYNFQK